MTYHLMSLVLY